jgi:EAL and modified HD-GYP domain-containing signal transduction protein
VAYELLFRSAHDSGVFPDTGESATSMVLMNAFSELPIHDVLEGKKAFVNFTDSLLLDPPKLDPTKIVIEVLETVVLNDEMITALTELKKHGFTIALDDFEYQAGCERALLLADIIKFDVLALSEAELHAQIELVKPYQCQLLAEKIEDYEMFEHCRALGFDFFQGYFLSKPQVISGKRAAENKKAVLDLLNVLQNPEVEISHIAPAISKDPVLSYKLLRVINSPLFGLATDIQSIQHATALLGIDRIKTWATMLILAGGGDKPHELSVCALNRARLCQLLREAIKDPDNSPDTYFITGMFSCIDAFLDTPKIELMERLALNSDIKRAITEFEGPLGICLRASICCEQGLWESIDWDYFCKHDITPEHLETAYLDSLKWTKDTLENLS